MGFATITSISLRVVAFLVTGLLLEPAVWLTAAFVIPAVLLGIYGARRIFLCVSRERLMRAGSVLLFASGASLLWRSLAS